MKKITLLMAGMVFAAGTSYGVMIQEGARELSVSGDLQFKSAVGTWLDLQGKAGYFIMDGVQVGMLAGIENNDAWTQWEVGAFTEYNHDLGMELVPFVGVSVSYAYLDPDAGSSEDSIVLGGYAGGKYFIAENIAISLDYLFQLSDEDLWMDDNEPEDTNHSLRLGMRFYF